MIAPTAGGTGAHERVVDLGTRPIGRLLWHACSQTTLSVGTYGIYALTNAWFVARGVGPTAMAAVNLVAPLLLALGALSTALGVGAASVVSRALGAGDTRRAARTAGNAFVVFWSAAIATTVVGLLALDPLLRALAPSRTPSPTRATTRRSSWPARSSRPGSRRWCAPRDGCGSPRRCGWSRCWSRSRSTRC